MSRTDIRRQLGIPEQSGPRARGAEAGDAGRRVFALLPPESAVERDAPCQVGDAEGDDADVRWNADAVPPAAARP